MSEHSGMRASMRQHEVGETPANRSYHDPANKRETEHRAAARRMPDQADGTGPIATMSGPRASMRAVTNAAAVLAAYMLDKLGGLAGFLIVSFALPVSTFGLYTLVLAVGQIVYSVASFGLDQVLIRLLAQTDSKDQRKRLLWDGIVLKLLCTFLASGLSIDLALLLDVQQDLVSAIVIVAGDLVVINLAATLTAYYRSRLRSVSATVLQALSQMVYLALLLAMVRAGVPWYFLLDALLVSDAALCVALAWRVSRILPSGPPLAAPRRMEILASAVPLGVVGVGVLLYSRLDTVLLAQLRGPTEVAYYSAAYRLAEAPLAVISALALTALPFISAWSDSDARREQVVQATQRVLRYTYTLALLVAVPLSFFSGEIVITLYGPRYAAIAPTVTMLIWATVAISTNLVATTIITALGRQWWLVAPMLINIAINVWVNLLVIPRWGYYGSAVATTVTESLNMVMQLGILCWLLRRPSVAIRAVLPIVLGVGSLALTMVTSQAALLQGAGATVCLLGLLVLFGYVGEEDLLLLRSAVGHFMRSSTSRQHGGPELTAA
jgi:O-antigen/teichoic acid export membrane protein